MKKVLFGILVITLLLLVGCGSDADVTVIDGDVSDDGTEVEVVEADDTVAEEMAEEATGDETEEVADEMEDESEEMEESMDEEESEEATEDEESMDADDGAIEIAGCTDSDGGMNYDVAGDIVDVNGIEDSDYCSQNENYPGRLYENYCQDSGKYGRETYDCPSGSCVLGACVPVAE